MKQAWVAYGKSFVQPAPLFDKVLTIDGQTIDTATYRKEQRKESETESVKKPLVGSVFSQYMDGLA